MNKIRLSLISTLLMVANSNAGVEATLNNVLKSFNGTSNISKSHAALNQRGGLYSPGSAMMRLETSNYNLVYFTPPSLDIGCNGIDLNLGALSHISTDNFKRAFKNIAANSAAIALKVAMAELSPKLEGSVSELQALVEEASRHNFNSCEAAYSFVGGMLPKSEAARKTVCTGLATSTNQFSDWAKANQECGRDPKSAGNSEAVKELQGDTLVDDFNLIWKALEKTNLSNGTKELYMSVCGTLVLKTPEGEKKMKIQPFGALGKQEDMIKFLIFGTKEGKLKKAVSLYRCNDTQECLSIKTEEAGKSQMVVGIYDEVLALLNSIRTKSQGKDTTLSEAELFLIEKTSVPVLKMIAIQFSSKGSHISNDLIAEYVAEDMAIKYLISITDFVMEHTDRLKAAQANDSTFYEFQNRLDDLRKILSKRRGSLIEKLSYSLRMISQLERLESQNITLISQGRN